jgi:hypothetical protein
MFTDGSRLDSHQGIQPAAEQRPDKSVAGSSKSVASRFYQLKMGHCLTGQYPEWTRNRQTAKCWPTGHRHGTTCSKLPPAGSASTRSCGPRYGRRVGEGRIDSRTGTSGPTGGAASRCWTSSPSRLWGGGSRPRLRTTLRERHQSGNSGRGERKRRGEEGAGRGAGCRG